MRNKLLSLFLSIVLSMTGVRTSVYAQSKEVVIEGVLKMYYLNNEGDCNVISQYRNTDGRNTYLAFVVDLGKKVNVLPYLDENERDLLDKPHQSAIMIVPKFKYSAKEFAAKYANKRVHAKGSLYVPGAGWRNATPVVMSLNSIKLVDGTQSIQRPTGSNNVQQKSNTPNKINITGNWTCTSKEIVENQFGEKSPSWTFDLKLKATGNEIKGDYFASYPLCMRFDGNLYDNYEDDFDIKGRWDGEKYVVKYHSSHDADVVAHIKPISSRKIEWRIVSIKGGCTMAPSKAILIKEQ